MQQIVYIISVIYIFVTFILGEKSKEKISFLKFFMLSIVIFLCYNTFICFIMSNIGVPINLITLSIFNFAIGSIPLYQIIKNKTIQKYYFKLRNAVAVVAILIISVAFFIMNFGSEFEIKYIATDAAVHYAAARDFYKNDKLLDKVEDTIISKQFMTAAYINTGILFKVTEPVVGEINLYKVFILFDIFSIFMVGVLLYCAVEKIIKSYVHFLITMLMIGFFMIGYPFNSLICGYVYMQLGVIIIEAIIIAFQLLNEEVNKKYVYTMLLLFNYAIFFAYCIFLPVLYIVEFLYLIVKARKQDKKIFSKKNLLVFFTIFVIPIICGIFYYVIPYLTSVKTEDVFLNIEGYIYRNCWSNFIFFIPLVLMCLKKRNADTKFLLLFTVVLTLTMIAIFIAVSKFELSTYYYYKYNFVLWFVLWYGATYAINITEGKLNIALMAYILVYVAVASIAIECRNVDITKEIYDEDENIINAFDIYCVNKTIVMNAGIDYINPELELIEYIYNNIEINNDNKMLVISAPRQEWWFTAIFNYKNREDPQLVIPKEEILKWNNGDYKYLLLLYRNEYYEKYKNVIKYGELITENQYGAIYENK